MTEQHKMIWNEVKDYMFIALGLAIYTVAFTVFLMPYQIVAGGVTGLSAIIYYATGFHLENTYIIINGLLLIVALKILGLKFLMKTIFAIFTLYFMLMFAQEIMPKQDYAQARQRTAVQTDGRGTGLHVDDHWLCADRSGSGHCLPAQWFHRRYGHHCSQRQQVPS